MNPNIVIFVVLALFLPGAWLIAKAITRRAPESLTQRVTGGLAYPRMKQPKTAGAGSAQNLLNSAKALFEKSAVSRAILPEMPDVLDLLSVSVSAGDGIYAALCRVVPKCDGKLAGELGLLLRRVELGETLENGLAQFANENPLAEVREFANKLSLALRRGTPLAQLLSDQAETIRGQLRNDLLKAAGRNETRMLIPLIFMILPVTVLFATYPSLQLLQLTI